MFLLGIVGSPGAGKSSVSEYLASLGAEWINADLIARDCLGIEEVRRKLGEKFGASIFFADGTINRSAIAERVFGQTPEKVAGLEFLESVVHPMVRRQITERLISAAQMRTPAALLDVPLLFESGWDRSCDAIWCVDAEREIRVRRTVVRGWDSEQLARRESNQMPIETKKRLSNRIMRNDSTLESLHEKLRAAWRQLGTMKQPGTIKQPGAKNQPGAQNQPGSKNLDHSTAPSSSPPPHCRTDFPVAG